MNILVTNDDGIDSPGILALVQALKKIGHITVIAPDRQQSAVGHALTVSAPLRAVPFQREGDLFGFAVNGTPADCVKLGVSTLLSIKPDLVVSGINHGANTAVNVMYSGTVSAATEAMMIGIPALAVSLTSFSLDADMSVAAEYAAKVAGNMLEWDLPIDTILNMNVPAIPKEDIKGMRITRLSNSYWDDSYDSRKDPMGREYHWIVGTYRVPEEADIETDD
jgi:5'-nucleotidase